MITWTYLRNERDVYSRVRFDEFDKYLSSNVPQELCNTTSHDQLHLKRKTVFFQNTDHARGLKTHSQLTLYVLSNEGVVHYVTVICFQDFLKFSDVIVLVGAGGENSQCCYIIHIVSL